MNCLLFLYGEKRTFETAYKFWNILDIPNLDIVIHTPNTTSDYLTSQEYKEVSVSDFNILGTPQVFLHDRNDFIHTDDHVLHFSYRFLSNYLKESKKYDYIFIGRLDSTFYIENWEKLLIENQNKLFTLGEAQGNTFIQDHAFFGSYEMIKKLVDNLPNREYLSNDPHGSMCRYIAENFNEKTWKSHSFHLRPNMIRYFEAYINKKGNLKNIDNDYTSFLYEEFLPKYDYKLDIEYKKGYRVDWVKDYVFKNNELEEMFSSFLSNLNENNYKKIEIRGCMDNNSNNYNKYATIDDGTCAY